MLSAADSPISALAHSRCPLAELPFLSSPNWNTGKRTWIFQMALWCPGSSFKPVTAAVGLETGAVNPEEDYGKEGLSWQKDSSWGSYYVTTLHEYEPAILENALVYSDNIYFAKAALKIGAENMAEGLRKLGFGESVPSIACSFRAVHHFFHPFQHPLRRFLRKCFRYPPLRLRIFLINQIWLYHIAKGMDVAFLLLPD